MSAASAVDEKLAQLAMRFYFFCQFFEPAAQDLVIVAAEGIPGYVRPRVMIEQFLRPFLIVGQIVHACRYDSNGVRNKLFWPAAFRTMTTHVSHLAVHTVSQPSSES